LTIHIFSRTLYTCLLYTTLIKIIRIFVQEYTWFVTQW
jgi:hypothetical protein